MLVFKIATGLITFSIATSAYKKDLGVGSRDDFQHQVSWTFENNTLPEGLVISSQTIGDNGGTHKYTPSNVALRDGYLELLVNGGQSTKPYTCGQVATSVDNILFASVRTVAILSKPPGVCNGMFFYSSDSQETDIEWLSDSTSPTNQGVAKVYFTNQDNTGGDNPTTKGFLPPVQATDTEHEYRIDWTQEKVEFYIDGTKLWETSDNVPSEPGRWIWNNWTNGNRKWPAGPPTEDAIFKIKKIDMFYNTV